MDAVAQNFEKELTNSIQPIQTCPRQRSKHINALLYKVNFTRRPREPAPCESKIDEVEVRKVGTFACEYVLRLDVNLMSRWTMLWLWTCSKTDSFMTYLSEK